VKVAWKLHSAAAWNAFREALPTDDATWERARGWALSQAIGAVTYYTVGEQPLPVPRGRGAAALAGLVYQRLASVMTWPFLLQ
jgi:hypothetical protein